MALNKVLLNQIMAICEVRIKNKLLRFSLRHNYETPVTRISVDGFKCLGHTSSKGTRRRLLVVRQVTTEMIRFFCCCLLFQTFIRHCDKSISPDENT